MKYLGLEKMLPQIAFNPPLTLIGLITRMINSPLIKILETKSRFSAGATTPQTPRAPSRTPAMLTTPSSAPRILRTLSRFSAGAITPRIWEAPSRPPAMVTILSSGPVILIFNEHLVLPRKRSSKAA